MKIKGCIPRKCRPVLEPPIKEDKSEMPSTSESFISGRSTHQSADCQRRQGAKLFSKSRTGIFPWGVHGVRYYPQKETNGTIASN